MRVRNASILVAAATALAFTPRQEVPPLLGFSRDEAATQYALEARFDADLDAADQRAWMERLTRQPFWTGSPYNREMADWVAQQFRDWGFQVELERFDVLYPTPKIRELQLLSPTPYTARLREPTLEQDRTSGIETNRLPTFNAYSADGDVTGELVYVNYGIPDDYEELERRGIDVAGKIVIARYGGSWRGIKPKARSSIPTPSTTGTARATCTRTAATGWSSACSAARSWTCRSTRATRSRRGTPRRRTPRGCRWRRRRRS